jgi:hypothetical protein
MGVPVPPPVNGMITSYGLTASPVLCAKIALGKDWIVRIISICENITNSIRSVLIAVKILPIHPHTAKNVSTSTEVGGAKLRLKLTKPKLKKVCIRLLVENMLIKEGLSM